MATRKTAAAKATSSRARGAAADPAATLRDAFTQPLKGLADRLQNLELSSAAGALMENGRKDLEALVKANEKSYQGLQKVVQRQTEMLRSAISDWQGVVAGMPGKDPQQAFAQLDAMGRAAFQRALDDMRELAELAAKSQADAFEIVRQRINANVDQASQLLRKKGSGG